MNGIRKDVKIEERLRRLSVQRTAFLKNQPPSGGMLNTKRGRVLRTLPLYFIEIV